MLHHIELDICPNDSILILEAIDARIHYWEDRQIYAVVKKHRCPSTVEYDDDFIECRIRELRALRSVYLEAVRRSPLTSDDSSS